VVDRKDGGLFRERVGEGSLGRGYEGGDENGHKILVAKPPAKTQGQPFLPEKSPQEMFQEIETRKGVLGDKNQGNGLIPVAGEAIFNGNRGGEWTG